MKRNNLLSAKRAKMLTLSGLQILFLLLGNNHIEAQDSAYCPESSMIVFEDIGQQTTYYVCSDDFDDIDVLTTHWIDAISPNCLYGARYTHSQDSFEITPLQNADHADILLLERQPNWLASGLFWLNNENISFYTMMDGDFRDERVIINPWTGETRVIRPALPEHATHIQYDPTLTQVTFRSVRGGEELLSRYDFDTSVTSQISTIYSLTPPFSYSPFWASDGTEFLYIRSTSTAETFEIFRVDENGEESQITDLGTSSRSPSLFSRFAWSPDRRYVAFWWLSSEIFMDREAMSQFFVYDLEYELLYETDLRQPNGAPFIDINWSPDSTQVALIMTDTDSNPQLVIYDAISATYQFITQNATQILRWCSAAPDD